MINLVILLVMIAVIITSIAMSNWKMTKRFGYLLFLFYFAYLAIALGITPRSDFKRERCNADDDG